MLPKLVLVAALATGGASHRELAAAAGASPRPKECSASGGSAAPGELWERVRSAEQQPFCALLARAHARLGSNPDEALTLADAAMKKRPEFASAHIVRARALARLGRAGEAWTSVKGLTASNAKGFWVDDPSALHELARIALEAGDDSEALALYELLVARSNLFADDHERFVALVEAGALALSRGPDKLETAEVYFEEARRASRPGSNAILSAFGALALDRAGRTDQARAAAREGGGPSELERYLSRSEREHLGVALTAAPAPDARAAGPHAGPERPEFVFPSGELLAALGVMAEAKDPKLADLCFHAYLEDARASHGPWAEHARHKTAAKARGGQAKPLR